MRYADALEWQFALSERWKDHGLEISQGMIDLLNTRASLTKRDLDLMIGYPLVHGETVFVAGTICDALEQAAPALPEESSLHESDVVYRQAFCLFEKAVPCPESGFGTVEAMSWVLTAEITGAPTGSFNFTEMSDEEFAGASKRLHLATYARVSGTLFPVSVYQVRMDSSITDCMADAGQTKSAVASEFKVRLFMALLFFMQQPYVVTSKATDFDRATRKRVAQWAHEQAVRVVKLRVAQSHRQQVDGREPVEWSCRWLVQGHWHTYHTKKGTQARWLMPYVKGPGDKPLKVPRARIYAVVR